MSRDSPDTVLGPLVKAEGLGHVYRTGASQVVALHGLDLELAAGETVAIGGTDDQLSWVSLSRPGSAITSPGRAW